MSGRMPPSYHAAYYQKNRDRLLARQHERYVVGKEAYAEASRARRKRNAERINRERREHRKAHIEQYRVRERRYTAKKALDGSSFGYWIKRLYGIDAAGYSAILASQGGVCALCRRAECRVGKNGAAKRLAVDHDHETGAIRGLLCFACNSGLGVFDDDSERLRRAADYIDAARPIARRA